MIPACVAKVAAVTVLFDFAGSCIDWVPVAEAEYEKAFPVARKPSVPVG